MSVRRSSLICVECRQPCHKLDGVGNWVHSNEPTEHDHECRPTWGWGPEVRAER